MWVWLLLNACGGVVPVIAPPPEPPPEPPAEVIPELAPHWVHATEARDAVYAGDLVLAQHAARDLGADPVWQTLDGDGVEPVLAAAALMVEAEDVTTAARQLGALAVGCGNCHASAAVTIATTPLPVPSGTGIVALMAHHRRTSELLWRGMVVPSDAALVSGAVALVAQRPLTQHAIAERFDDSTLAAEFETAVVEKASAVKAATGAARGEAYAELLVVCATCHLLSGDGPDPGWIAP